VFNATSKWTPGQRGLLLYSVPEWGEETVHSDISIPTDSIYSLHENFIPVFNLIKDYVMKA
jgi:hypothetical protein